MYLETPYFSEDATLNLFLLKPEHVTPDYVSWLNTPAINQYLESRFVNHDVESTREFVATILESPHTLFLGIKSRTLNKHVGNIKLGPIDTFHGTADIGILIGDEAAWGKGVATSAIKMMSVIAQHALNLRKLTAGCYASNVGSQRAFEKAGFTVEATRPAQFLLNKKPENLVLMGCILK